MTDVVETQIDSYITSKYKILERLGRGAYGVVWKAEEKASGCVVAVKKVYDAFRNATDAQRTFREVVYLKAFIHHENIITLLDVAKAANHKDLYLVFDHMDTDLKRAVDASILSDEHNSYIMYQIMRGLHYLHSGDVIHRDLKPDNILLNSACDVKIADFGLARSIREGVEEEEDAGMTEYVATRWYRSPEILLGASHYSHVVDIWSSACIFGYMLKRGPLFAGKSSHHQFHVIMECLGKPSSQVLRRVCSAYSFDSFARSAVRKSTSLKQLIRGISPVELSFLQDMLVIDPCQRPRTEQLLGHLYLRQFRDKSTEIVMQSTVVVADADAARKKVHDYRALLYKAIEDETYTLKASSSFAMDDERALEEGMPYRTSKHAVAASTGRGDDTVHGTARQSDRSSPHTQRSHTSTRGLNQNHHQSKPFPSGRYHYTHASTTAFDNGHDDADGGQISQPQGSSKYRFTHGSPQNGRRAHTTTNTLTTAGTRAHPSSWAIPRARSNYGENHSETNHHQGLQSNRQSNQRGRHERANARELRNRAAHSGHEADDIISDEAHRSARKPEQQLEDDFGAMSVRSISSQRQQPPSHPSRMRVAGARHGVRKESDAEKSSRLKNTQKHGTSRQDGRLRDNEPRSATQTSPVHSQRPASSYRNRAGHLRRNSSNVFNERSGVVDGNPNGERDPSTRGSRNEPRRASRPDSQWREKPKTTIERSVGSEQRHATVLPQYNLHPSQRRHTPRSRSAAPWACDF